MSLSVKQGISRPRQNIHNIKINSIALSSTGQDGSQGSGSCGSGWLPNAECWRLWEPGGAPGSCSHAGEWGTGPCWGKGGATLPIHEHQHFNNLLSIPLFPPNPFRNTCRTISWLSGQNEKKRLAKKFNSSRRQSLCALTYTSSTEKDQHSVWRKAHVTDYLSWDAAKLTLTLLSRGVRLWVLKLQSRVGSPVSSHPVNTQPHP